MKLLIVCGLMVLVACSHVTPGDTVRYAYKKDGRKVYEISCGGEYTFADCYQEAEKRCGSEIIDMGKNQSTEYVYNGYAKVGTSWDNRTLLFRCNKPLEQRAPAAQ